MSGFVEIPVSGIDPSLPGLYEWRIEECKVTAGSAWSMDRCITK